MTAVRQSVLTIPGSSDFPEGSWQDEAIIAFENRMLDRESRFPCIFGVDAVAKKTLRSAFVPATDQPGRLAEALESFTDICRELGRRTSLVCFFEQWHAERNHGAYYRRFWELLAETSGLDKVAWPAEYGPDTEDPKFEYCFNGVPMFVVVNTDIHELRRSRYFDRVAITFQPRFVFEDLKPDSDSGRNARTIIRGRLADYDRVALTSMVGNYGDPENHEWRQYYVDDGEDVISLGACPVHFEKKG